MPSLLPFPLPPILLLLLLLLCLSSSINGALSHPTSFLLDAARRDALRHQRLAYTVSHHRRTTCEVDRNANSSSSPSSRKSFSLPLISGAYSGTGQYFARFLVGTPAQRFLLILDTGSDLTWVKCKSNETTKGGSIFKPGNSTTFKPVSCSSSLCKSSLPFSLTECPTSSSPCLYDYAYSDGSKTQGLFGVDSATVRLTSSGHRHAKLPGIVVGCSSAFTGTSFRAADGVLGLGNSPTSFAAVAAARLGSARFAYCLVDHLSPKNSTGFLSFGAAAGRPVVRLKHAALVTDRQIGILYGVQVLGLSVNGKALNISRDIWNASLGGGVIADTGTSLTLLAEPAYTAVAAALSRALVRYPRVDLKPFEFCYNTTGGFDEKAVPRLAVHMAAHGGGGREVRLEPPVKSYVVDVADGVKCIGIMPAASPGVSTLGNILQQGHYWEFDVVKGRLSFGPSSC